MRMHMQMDAAVYLYIAEFSHFTHLLMCSGGQVVEVLVKWRESGYDLATWEELPAIEELPGAQPALERLRSLRPIGRLVSLATLVPSVVVVHQVDIKSGSERSVHVV